ncbi:MAG: hypothetical protein DCF29_09000 [Alphaproteobacteria bacterium]|nr:MAG: hypothetical protein DCF29_09000 [Alphaproteobacteria bacterium]
MVQRLIVPRDLQSRLAREPEALQRLQEALDRLSSRPIGYDPFEQAVWALKGALEACRQDVIQDLDEAEAKGDHSAADVARGRMRLLSPLIIGQISLDDIWRVTQDWEREYKARSRRDEVWYTVVVIVLVLIGVGIVRLWL